MIHIVVDAYGCNTARVNNLMDVYEVINTIVNAMGSKAVMPPQLVPYYYGKDPESAGISAFVLTEGGHFTIHTFPQLQCYFADLLYDGSVEEQLLKDVLNREFPADKFFIKRIDRNKTNDYIAEQYSDTDFGPHHMISAVLEYEPTVGGFMDMLDRLPAKIDMHAISRPCVLKSAIDNPRYLSGIVVIAESHIAVHYEYATHRLLMDIFSCKAIEENNYRKVIKVLFNSPVEDFVIRRGIKNNQLAASREEKFYSHKSWQDNILK